jgi:hypothetical protein
MLISLRRLAALPFLMIAAMVFAQEAEKKPGSISTEPKSTTVVLKTLSDQEIRITGEAVFTPLKANSDGAMTGKLSYLSSSDSRSMLAKAMDKLLSEIPLTFTINGVIGNFYKTDSCPEIQIAVSPMDAEIMGAKAHFDRFELKFQEMSQDVSKILCIWASGLQGRGYNPNAINPNAIKDVNRILKGEKEGQ